jgi:hypothetical protein
MEDWGSRVRFPAGAGNFSLLHHVQPALGFTQPPIQWVPGALSLRVKQPGLEADHSPPSSAEVNNAWHYTSTRNTSSWRGAQLDTGTTLSLYGHILSSKDFP